VLKRTACAKLQMATLESDCNRLPTNKAATSLVIRRGLTMSSISPPVPGPLSVMESVALPPLQKKAVQYERLAGDAAIL
jgi:hypothetical protein